jgi:hypothetical protein
MSQSEILRANFTISPAAKVAVERIRRDHDAQFPDPAAVLSVGWGFYIADSGPRWENVTIGFYTTAELPDVAHGIQEVSGLKLIFFITEEYLDRFEGKVLDHSDAQGFFMRNPD